MTKSSWRWLLGLWMSVLTTQCVSGDDCPLGCMCLQVEGVDAVSVQCLQATSVPSRWPSNTENIDIRFSKEPSNGVPPGAFAHLQGVKSISLRGKLGTLHSSAFYNLTGGTGTKYVLSFWDCNIDTVQMSAFNQISGYNIKFSSCKINSFKAGSLYLVSQMDELDMWSVSVGEVFERAFAGLRDVKTISIRQSTINVIYNYGFTGINGVQVFSTPGLTVKLCMGKYAFVGMERVERVDFSGGDFPLTPLLQSSSSEDNDILTCANGWVIPETSVWLYKNRVTIMLVLGFIVSALFFITILICCLRCRRNARRAGPGAAGERQRFAWFRQWIHWIRRKLRRRRIEADPPPAYDASSHSSSLEAEEMATSADEPTFSRLPSYEDCSKMAPPYSLPPVPRTPPPPYAIVLDQFGSSTPGGATSADYTFANPSFSIGGGAVEILREEDGEEEASHA
ncbi:hypothetical protein CAPTEDRAFT_185291 [Capitella teleta]|uniref:Uncharacterized protein n=1 Tax=Capitella teleta TaxID=283909 RepID=R7T567_CAPTE|nr:hypothetical protein CAPTEDRAFT_185291 [Capitella teleta]|eukprot:ELT88347.1 hypothetical protein CAPTEDRAFT_185291 [Capitella teleta]